MINLQLEDLKNRFAKTYDVLKKELLRVRTGRASSTMLDGIRVSYYGQPTALSQVANITVPEARLITVKPWEPNMLKEIERAIQSSDLGLTPQSDGQIIRLSIPPLNEERRKEMVKQVRRHGEDAKVTARNHRRDVNTAIQALCKGGKITEDDEERTLKKIQEQTDEAIKYIDGLLTSKEKELMEV